MTSQSKDEPSSSSSATIAAPTNRQQARTFPIRLYDMLQDAEKHNFSHIVSWLPCGNGFKIHEQQEFVQRILPHYFRHQTKYKSFTRQLNLYEFRFIKRNEEFPSAYENTGGYCHPKFTRGNRDQCADIATQRKTNTASSLGGQRLTVNTNNRKPEASRLSVHTPNRNALSHHHQLQGRMLLTRGRNKAGTNFQASRFDGNEEGESKMDPMLLSQQNSSDYGQQRQGHYTGSTEEDVRAGQYATCSSATANTTINNLAVGPNSPIGRRPIVPYTSKEDTNILSQQRDMSRVVEEAKNDVPDLSSCYMPFLRSNTSMGGLQGNVLDTNTALRSPFETKKEDTVVRLESRPFASLHEGKDEKKLPPRDQVASLPTARSSETGGGGTSASSLSLFPPSPQQNQHQQDGNSNVRHDPYEWYKRQEESLLCFAQEASAAMLLQDEEKKRQPNSSPQEKYNK